MLTTVLLLSCASAGLEPALLAEDTPRGIRLVADEPAPPGPELPSYVGWSRRQLQGEYERLKQERPGLGLPISLMASGGGVLLFSLNLLMLSLASSSGFSSTALPLLVVFGIAATAGATLAAIGAIVLSRVIPERRPYSQQLDEIDRLLKEGEGDPQPDQRQYLPPMAPDGPPPEGPPPPPLPPYSPQASVQLPLLLVRF